MQIGKYYISTRLCVVLYFMLVWGCKYLGIDIGQAISALMGVSQTVIDAARQMGQEPSTIPEWIGLAYIGSETILKSLGKKTPPKNGRVVIPPDVLNSGTV
jgi:hypothetical protein